MGIAPYFFRNFIMVWGREEKGVFCTKWKGRALYAQEQKSIGGAAECSDDDRLIDVWRNRVCAGTCSGFDIIISGSESTTDHGGDGSWLQSGKFARSEHWRNSD